MTDINIDGIVTWLSNWFQDKLVSGTNIKTINNQSLLGSGNISVGGGGGSSNLFDLNTVSQYGDNAIEEGVDRDGTGLGYGSDFLIYNSQEQKFYYDKNGNADYDTGNELATMNDIPTVPSLTTWTSQTISTYGTLYVNTALHLCEFRYYRTNYKFTSTSEVTLHSGAIPSAYRPKQNIICAVYNVTIIGAVTTAGNILAVTSTTGTKTINMTAFWHY